MKEVPTTSTGSTTPAKDNNTNQSSNVANLNTGTEGFFRQFSKATNSMMDRSPASAPVVGLSHALNTAASLIMSSNHHNSKNTNSTITPEDRKNGKNLTTTTTTTTTQSPVEQEAMDDRLVGFDKINEGALRAPGDLGVEQRNQQQQQQQQQQQERRNTTNNKSQTSMTVDDDESYSMHPEIYRSRQRIQQSEKRSKALQEILAKKLERQLKQIHREKHENITPIVYSCVTSFCYNGMEVLVGSTPAPAVYILNSRTHLVLQTLDMNVVDGNDVVDVISIQINANSGIICVVLSNGMIQSYVPFAVDPKEYCFGSYRWRTTSYINSNHTFYRDNVLGTFTPKRISCSGEMIDVSISRDGKILVAHHDQLAVFDSGYDTSVERNTNIKTQATEANLLWTTQLPAIVISAKISGDGYSIAFVMESPKVSSSEDSDDGTEVNGVYTFERDWDDGSSSSSSKVVDETNLVVPSSISLVDNTRAAAAVGIMFKPGPFLLHGSCVTRIAFRGLGHCGSSTSGIKNRNTKGNDLLLTYCKLDRLARIYDQCTWNVLTEWTTLPNSRVDWVKGISAFNIADLDGRKKSKGKRPSFHSSSTAYDNEGSSRPSSPPMNEVKASNFHSIHHNATTSNYPGAWVSELSFQGLYPNLRLLRLTYCKRGVDDWHPTMFEIISSRLPTGCAFRECILESDESAFSIEGIWPAWNSTTSNTPSLAISDNNHKVRGSATAFLGLGPNFSCGGRIGDTLIGGTQSLPSELRMSMSYPIPGKVTTLELLIVSDLESSTLSFGNPLRNILSLRHFDCFIPANVQRATPSMLDEGVFGDSLDYEGSRIVAEIDSDEQSISVTWHQPGTMSMLPIGWSPDDVAPKKTSALLYDFTRISDESLLPVPLSLPPLTLPLDAGDQPEICAVRWWRDKNNDSSPWLIALLTTGTIIVYEIPPLDSLSEMTLPFIEEAVPHSNSGTYTLAAPFEKNMDSIFEEYEVWITPDLEYGLGLRLESQVNGRSAVAGSFKRHPLNNDTLPAEKTGMISLGDQLLSVNDVELANAPFDDIVQSIRQAGIDSGPGNPIQLRFRRSLRTQNGKEIKEARSRCSSYTSDASVTRRTKEHIIGIGSNSSENKGGNCSESGSKPYSFQSKQESALSSILYMFLSAVPLSHSSHDYQHLLHIAPIELKLDFSSNAKVWRTALVVSCDGSEIQFTIILVYDDNTVDSAEVLDVGKFDFGSQQNESEGTKICSLQVLQPLSSLCQFTICDTEGQVFLLTLKIDESESPSTVKSVFNCFPLFRLPLPWSNTTIIRPYSATLIATLQNSTANDNSVEVNVWSANPGPGNFTNNSHLNCDDKHLENYVSSRVQNSWDDDFYVTDLKFFNFGFLDALPSLAIFSSKGVLLMRKVGGQSNWSLSIEVSCPTVPSSSVHVTNILSRSMNPCNFFPHIIPGVCSILSTSDEGMLRSDWHPDSILANICTDRRGARVAIQDSLTDMLVWLSSEGIDLPDDLGCHSLVSSVKIKESPNIVDLNVTMKRTNASEIQKIQTLIMDYLTIRSAKSSLSRNTPRREASNDNDDKMELAPLLRKISDQDLVLLWTLSGMVLSPPDFDDIDVAGQHFLFCDSLQQKVLNAPRLSSPAKQQPTFASLHSFQLKKPTSSSEPLGKTPTISSSGAFAALLSNEQTKLLTYCRATSSKLTWARAVELRIPFWLRCDKALAKLSEEIGQNLFRETRDVMECAIFFLIAGKRSTLRNLAATDRSEGGKTFYNFLTKYDFTTTRGRQAAEKNAFSLLRKNRYRVAAAFFLLPEPPQLKSCVEIIATKLHDVDLAFLVARLTESKAVDVTANAFSNSGSYNGILGIGGFTSGIDSSTQDNGSVKFENWQPSLGHTTKMLLVDRVFPKMVNDNAMRSLILVWLDRKLEANWVLTGILESTLGSKSTIQLVKNRTDQSLTNLFSSHDKENTPSSEHAALDKARIIIDFSSVPMLLNILGADLRAKEAATFFISNSLQKRGIELSAMRSLLDFSKDIENISCTQLEKMGPRIGSETERSSYPAIGMTKNADMFNGTKTYTTLDSNNFVSDIGISPHAARTNPQLAVVPVEHGAQSSIFDSYDMPPKASLIPNANSIQTSIFDSFDVPQKLSEKNTPSLDSKANGTNNAGLASDTGVQSSIFDNFDISMKPQIAAAPAEHGVQSSIFDSYDIPQIASQTPNMNSMQSSIFNSFDVPQKLSEKNTPSLDSKANGTNNAGLASDADTVQSSIFDSFDIPMKPLCASNAEVKQSSIFDQFDAPKACASLPPKPNITESSLANVLQPGGHNNVNHTPSDTTPCIEPDVNVTFAIVKDEAPELWRFWERELLIETAGRRLIRVIASVVSQFHGDPIDPTIQEFYSCSEYLISNRASEVLQQPCDACGMLKRIRDTFEGLSKSYSIDELALLQSVSKLLGNFYKRRLIFWVLLYAAVGRGDLAENVVRSVSVALIQQCRSFTGALDSLVFQKKSRVYVASQQSRREAARLSLNLESALWLHRGGGLPLSGTTLVEAIVAVRLALLFVSWNRNFECIDALLRSHPDLNTDEEAVSQLLVSLKVLDTQKRYSASSTTSSGGWEFLVDCKRAQATELLRDRTTGTFIIRPHAADHGVFTLSFKTNLIPGPTDPPPAVQSCNEVYGSEELKSEVKEKKHVRKDDVVQHAIIRLAETGFRCGSFGPFTSLKILLEAVSDSLPFKLRFDLPPKNRVIKEEGFQTSPNAVLFRRLALRNADSLASNPPDEDEFDVTSTVRGPLIENRPPTFRLSKESIPIEQRQSILVKFFELLQLSLFTRQLSTIAFATNCDYENESAILDNEALDGNFAEPLESPNQFILASRILHPLLKWCRAVEIETCNDMAPALDQVLAEAIRTQSHITQLEDAIEVSPANGIQSASADTILRNMIQKDSGIDFTTLRLVHGSECTMVVLFRKSNAIQWLVSDGREQSEESALAWLKRMEEERVIESVKLANLPVKHKGDFHGDDDDRYRFVDPWEVEAVQSREGETQCASLGRDRFLSFSLSHVASLTNSVFRPLGGVPLLELWANTNGGLFLTKALATVHPPWERVDCNDLHVKDQPVPHKPLFLNSIQRYLYRNVMFRRLDLPQRFLVLVQVELLDLKNLATPGGSLSLTAYALLRLKRSGSGSVLTNKARTLDSASTAPIKLNKISGPNAPASWGSVVRFRFPLPDDALVDSTDERQPNNSLFHGPPSVLQVSVYEKKLLSDHSLGRADVNTDGLWAGGQVEEWVPLRSEKRGIKWFARIRLTLRFELMCLAPLDEYRNNSAIAPSVGLKKIEHLCHSGGSAHEDSQKRSVSSPDLLTYLEGMV